MTTFTIILLSLIASAFFSGMEIAFISANKLKVELETKNGNWFAARISYLNKFPSLLLGALLLGNNTSLVVFGIYMTKALAPLFATLHFNPLIVLILQTLCSTLLILVTAEFLPKSLFRINPNWVLNFFALPLTIIYWLFFPVVFIIIHFSEWVLKSIFRVSITHEKEVFQRIDLDHYIREATQPGRVTHQEQEVKLFKNVLDFSKVKARECMIPRNEIVAMEVNEPINKLKDRFIYTRLSKILIFDRHIDNIIGYVHSHEFFQNPDLIRTILLPVSIVPESMPANEVLTLLIHERRSIAIVVDEFGGTAGMLTMEDVIEEIFGEIEDEHDKDELIERQITPEHFVFSGRLELDYLNEKYRLNLPQIADVETLSGLIVFYAQSIPQLNQEIQIESFRFKVIALANNRIEQAEVFLIE